MRLVIQRVREARVEVGGRPTGSIAQGLLVLVAVARTDTPADADYLAEKLLSLRIFSDDEGKMNRSVAEIGGSLLVVSNFTLYGDCTKGRRPGFDLAAPPEQARALYEYFLGKLRSSEVPVETGIFQASMAVHLVNDGPVTLLCESKKEKPHRNGS
jgi:D-tyrosyl-tRNA(Tyr) deacylase